MLSMRGVYRIWFLSHKSLTRVCMCSQLDKIEGVFERPSDEVIRELSRALRQALGVSLFGIDIIINNQTGQHAVIDVNAFPGEPRGWVTLHWWSSGCLISSRDGKRVSLAGDGRTTPHAGI